MPEDSSMLVLLRAVSDPDRLRVIGALSRGPARAACLAESLGLPLRQILHHLDRLTDWGLLHAHADLRQHITVYELDPLAVEEVARRQLKRPPMAYIPAAGWDAPSRKVLAVSLHADGTIKHIPSQSGKRKVIHRYLIQAFEPGVDYSEKEVNAVLRRFHEDTAGLRRELVDEGWLDRERDGSRYWRKR